MIRRHCLHCI